jgi:uncharacterized membrane protein YphA (DoxX/SURF4 family)
MAFDTAAFASTWTPRALAVLRIVSGYLFLLHGSAKLIGLPQVAAFDDLRQQGARVVPRAQWRRRGGAVLLRLSVHLCGRRRPMEC